MYDFAHGLSDAFEGVTHSLCTLEFEDHRELYDWFLDQLEPEHRPYQYEFSRLNLAYTLTSKRKLNQLVEEGHVSGWDDPRAATLAGMRRRGYPPEAVRDFIGRVGVTKKENLIEMGVLENSVREHFDYCDRAPHGRTTAIESGADELPGRRDRDDDRTESSETRRARDACRFRFGREIYIERTDFMEEAPRKFFRLKPDGEVRLRFGYIIRCDAVIIKTMLMVR